MDEPRDAGRTGPPVLWLTDAADAPLRGCTFGPAVRRFFGRYATFSGRSSRSEFWKITLPLVAVGLVAQQAASWPGDRVEPVAQGILLVSLLIGLVTALPALALSVRRLHDANFSGWLVLLTLIPLGGLVLLVRYAMDSHPVGARFDRRFVPHTGR